MQRELTSIVFLPHFSDSSRAAVSTASKMNCFSRANSSAPLERKLTMNDASEAMACTPEMLPAWKLETANVVLGCAGASYEAIFATARAAAWTGWATVPNADQA